MVSDTLTRFPSLSAVLTALPELQRATALAVLADRHYPAEGVAATLAAYGHPVSASTIRTYRRAVERSGK